MGTMREKGAGTGGGAAAWNVEETEENKSQLQLEHLGETSVVGAVHDGRGEEDRGEKHGQDPELVRGIGRG
jgi:hypothetical protein